jgi:hypothetical protein
MDYIWEEQEGTERTKKSMYTFPIQILPLGEARDMWRPDVGTLSRQDNPDAEERCEANPFEHVRDT